MLAYWMMFLIPAALTLSIKGHEQRLSITPWVILGCVFTILVGLRHDIGGDWSNYINNFHVYVDNPLLEIISSGRYDPAYALLNWTMGQLGWGIYGVNFFGALIFVVGLIIFCRQQPNPWLAFTVAIPYLIIVVSMGYTRQGIAIGLFMWAIVRLQKGSFLHYILLLLVAALFHKTAVVLIPLGVFLSDRGLFIRLVAVAIAAYGAWDLLLAEQGDDLWKNYVEAQMQSEGAKIRVIMNLLPSLVFLYYRKVWKELFDDYWLWFWLAVGSIAAFLLVGVASTAVDRMALYLIPIQIVVFSRWYLLVVSDVFASIVTLTVILFYSAVLFVWLNFATHAFAWLPYQNLLLK